jgi:WD40-like Beta Propeller Repeat
MRLIFAGLALCAALLLGQPHRVVAQTGIVYIGRDNLDLPAAFFINSDGTSNYQIPLDLVSIDHPKWSRDGTLIVAQGTASNGSSPDVFTFNRFGGSSLHKVTTISLTGFTVEELFPALSPDKKSVVVTMWLQSVRDGTQCGLGAVYSTIDGTLLQMLPGGCGQPGEGFFFPGTGVDWSPKASLIVVPLDELVQCGLIPVVATQIVAGPPVAGGTPTAVTHPNPCLNTLVQIHDVWPQFSPDGNKVAYVRFFISGVAGASELRTVNLDGSNDQLVFSFPGELEQGISWSPTGTQLLFDRSEIQAGVLKPGSLGLWKINTDGTGLTQFKGPLAAAPNWAFNAVSGQLLNISTRLEVLTGNNVAIGGFIVTGTANKQVLLRALGPTLRQLGVNNALADPTIELHDHTGAAIASNDNWKDTQEVAIAATGKAPPDNLESAILRTLAPGSYTAIVRGKNSATGVALVEAYDLDQVLTTTLANISTRGFVGTGSNVMIGGAISGNGIVKVIVRVLGPTLAQLGVLNVLADPTLELHDANGAVIASNDNWQDTQQADIQATGLAPPNPLESAIVLPQSPGNSTAIVRGKNNATGVALVEVYNLAAN